MGRLKTLEEKARKLKRKRDCLMGKHSIDIKTKRKFCAYCDYKPENLEL